MEQNHNKDQADFELICLHKDTNPSNLNQVFHTYGCHTLEAKAPVVRKDLVEGLMNSSREERHLATLEFKSMSGHMAIDGKRSRTRNRPLSMVEVNGETIISAGEARDRSPVNRNELDDELEAYMEETKRLKKSFSDQVPTASSNLTKSEASSFSRPLGSILNPIQARLSLRTRDDKSGLMNRVKTKISPDSKETNGRYFIKNETTRQKSKQDDSNLSREVLDLELDSYMQQANHMRQQALRLSRQQDGREMMEDYEATMNENDMNFFEDL